MKLTRMQIFFRRRRLILQIKITRLFSHAGFLLLFLFFSVLIFSCSPSTRFASNSQPGRYPSVSREPANEGFVGEASYYGPKFHGKKTANGEIFDMYKKSAAHKTLPFNTRVRVTNLRNNKSVVVRINNRGPYIKGRIIDLSLAAARQIQMTKAGVVPVKVEVLPKNLIDS